MAKSESQPTVRERATAELARGLRDFGVITGRFPGAGTAEAEALVGYLEEAGLLIAEDPQVATAVAVDLKRMGMAMPEQYDLFREGRQIGYLRLRHGQFKAVYPDHRSAQIVYSANTRGQGSFQDDAERAEELQKAVVALLEADGVANPAPIFEIAPYIEDDGSGGSFGDFIREFAARTEKNRTQGLARISELPSKRSDPEADDVVPNGY